MFMLVLLDDLYLELYFEILSISQPATMNGRVEVAGPRPRGRALWNSFISRNLAEQAT